MLDLTRLPEWDRALARVTERHLDTPWEWGVSDCLMTAFDAVEAVTGVRPEPKLVGKYRTEAGAARILKRRGFDDVEQGLASLFAETGILMARRGDLGTIERSGQIAAGYVTEHGVAVKSPAGLEFHPQTLLRAAFKVG